MNLFKISYTINKANESQIREHLNVCSNLFQKPLSKSVNINDYSQKINKKAYTIEAWDLNNNLVGLVAIYLNDLENLSSFITNVSVDESFQRKGISIKLLSNTILVATEKGFKTINLSVNKDNTRAIKLYEKFDFKEFHSEKSNILMIKYLTNE